MTDVRRRVCLIGLDGLRSDIAIDGGGMPRLAELAARGSFYPMTVAVPTWSGPSWSTILTGVPIAEHGVTDNTFLGSRLVRHPDVLSRAFYADQTVTTFAAAAWPPLVDPRGLGPIIHERDEQHRAGQHRVVVRDGETYGYEVADAEIYHQALWALTYDCPDASFLYFCGADEAGHGFGPLSPEYDAALVRLDAHLDGLLRVIERRAANGDEDWLVIVTTDHGHLDEGGHGGDSAIERAAFVVAWRPAGELSWPAVLAPTDIAPLMLAHLTPA